MSHDDFAFEPIPGLPEALPEGERMLWQGRPDWWRLAVESLGLKWVAGYFILLAFWRWATLVEPMGIGPALVLALPFIVSGLIVVGFIALFAWVQARSALYTITTARVVMRIGAAMTVTLQFPFSKIASADLDLRKGGTGTVALQLSGACPLGYAMCWPHVRPWKMREVQPALRAIPDAERVATLLASAAEARLAMPQVAKIDSLATGGVAAE